MSHCNEYCVGVLRTSLPRVQFETSYHKWRTGFLKNESDFEQTSDWLGDFMSALQRNCKHEAARFPL